MEWAEGVGRHSARAGAGESRSTRRPLDDRLDSWVSRGRELVDGVSGARPGSRPVGRGGERGGGGGGGRGGLEGLGRWVEGRLDWLLDDRDDWREPWQEAERPATRRGEDGPGPSGRSRVPLEAISRRGARGRSLDPPPPAPARAEPPDTAAAADQPDWPDPEAFQVARWRRESPAPRQAANPLAASPPAPPPGRPLPRSTRRR
jgi:hypothetical protein